MGAAVAVGERDLFGDQITSPEPVVNSTKRRKTQPKGYAAAPGTGPKGETCKGCDHYCRVAGGGSVFRKCFLVKARWTNGPGTDIKASSPACGYWKKAEAEEEK